MKNKKRAKLRLWPKKKPNYELKFQKCKNFEEFFNPIAYHVFFLKKIQPKHETQSCFSDEKQNMIHYPLFLKKSAQDFSFHFIPNAKNLREKFSQNMKRKDVFQKKLKIRYIIHFFWKKARKIFHSKIIPKHKIA